MWNIEKRDRALVAALLFAALSVPLTVAISRLFPPPVPPKDKSSPQNESNGLTFFIGLESFATAVIAGFAFIQVLEDRKSSERQLRAYVLLEEARVERIGIGEHPKAVLKIKNFGQTPAKEVRHCAIIGYVKVPDTDDPLQKRTVDDPKSIIGPGMHLLLHPELKTDIVTAEMLTEIGDGKMAIYVVGKITYVDCFGKEQSTKYRLRSGGPIRLGDLAMEGPGNDAT